MKLLNDLFEELNRINLDNLIPKATTSRDETGKIIATMRDLDLIRQTLLKINKLGIIKDKTQKLLDQPFLSEYQFTGTI